MNIDWASLGLVAITTVVAAVAIVGIFSLGVTALTSGGEHESGGALVMNPPSAIAKIAANGPIIGLVNNAGAHEASPSAGLSLAEFEKCMRLNASAV